MLNNTPYFLLFINNFKYICKTNTKQKKVKDKAKYIKIKN